MHSGDTIAAISSAVGPAARMIVRVSGPWAWGITQAISPDASLSGSTALPAALRLGAMTVPLTLYAFQSPRSYTGEDLVEFHIPGNPLLARLLLDELIAHGARPAEAGEFTARAYFHGRLDLTEAEGVAAAIAAHGEQELRAARQLLSGELARRLRPVMELTAETLALIEVGIDFTEEDVSFLSAPEIARRIEQADAMLRELVEQSARFEKLTHEPRAVLVGRPNAGKSTLLNALAGKERAIVSPTAGTTRDAVSAEIALERGMLRLSDVAGIDFVGSASADGILPESEAHSSRTIPSAEVDPTASLDIEQQMYNRALRELETADIVLLVHDGSSPQEVMQMERSPDLIVFTKSDLALDAPVPSTSSSLYISSRTGRNLDLLRRKLDELAFGSAPAGATLALNSRHLAAIAEARAAFARAARLVAGGGEFIALDLRDALDALGGILGRVSPDDLLGRIFSAFCIGK